MNQDKTILICPLNWGLGHATRCVPIINFFLENSYKVIVATESPLTEFFKERFPEIELEFLPGPRITYQHKGSLTLKIIRQIPGWAIWMLKEKKLIKKLVEKHRPLKIISDNRYGVRVKGIKSILITHQLAVKLPLKLHFIERCLQKVIKLLISKFDECWIPDMADEPGVSGELSRKYVLPISTKFIGIQSRFMVDHNQEELGFPFLEIDILIILSGPEPQKNILKNLLTQLLHLSNYKVAMITGDPHLSANIKIKNLDNISFYPHLSQIVFKQLIEDTPIVISRSGYSSVMDFWYLQKNAILIPTPGQTEQEYLAHHLQKHFSVVSQHGLNKLLLNEAIVEVNKKNKIPKTVSNISFTL